MSLILRLPASVHAALKRLAAEDERSLNTYLVRALREVVSRAAGEPPEHPEA